MSILLTLFINNVFIIMFSYVFTLIPQTPLGNMESSINAIIKQVNCSRVAWLHIFRKVPIISLVDGVLSPCFDPGYNVSDR